MNRLAVMVGGSERVEGGGEGEEDVKLFSNLSQQRKHKTTRHVSCRKRNRIGGSFLFIFDILSVFQLFLACLTYSSWTIIFLVDLEEWNGNQIFGNDLMWIHPECPFVAPRAVCQFGMP